MASESQGTRERVLIAEDDAAQRLGLQQLLKSWGYNVDDASDGQEALNKIAEIRPAIVLSDMVMPNLDGLELLRALKQSHDSETTLVLLTAQGSVETAVEAIKQGAYDYLTKPIDPQRLRIVLDQISSRNDTLREVRALRRQLQDRGTFGRMSRTTPAMIEAYFADLGADELPL